MRGILFLQFSKCVLESTSGAGKEHRQGQQQTEYDMHQVLFSIVTEDKLFLWICINHIDKEDALALLQG